MRWRSGQRMCWNRKIADKPCSAGLYALREGLHDVLQENAIETIEKEVCDHQIIGLFRWGPARECGMNPLYTSRDTWDFFLHSPTGDLKHAGTGIEAGDFRGGEGFAQRDKEFAVTISG